jgi:hypothetical protein
MENLVKPPLTALRLTAGQARIAPLGGAGLLLALLNVALDTRWKDADAQEGDFLALWVYERSAERAGTEVDPEDQALLYLVQRQIGH